MGFPVSEAFSLPMNAMSLVGSVIASFSEKLSVAQVIGGDTLN